jgi:hypothetical protein
MNLRIPYVEKPRRHHNATASFTWNTMITGSTHDQEDLSSARDNTATYTA